MKKFLHKISEWDKKHPILDTVIVGVVVVLIIEMFNQRSPLKGLMFAFENPLMFIVNVLIVTTTLCLTLFLK